MSGLAHIDPHSARSLWRAVLVGEIRLATGARVPGFGKNRIALAQRQARAWIGTSDFEFVCALAGVDPHRAREAVSRFGADGGAGFAQMRTSFCPGDYSSQGAPS